MTSNTKQTCAIIDYGMGNLHSAHGALVKAAEDLNINADILVTSDPEQILKADRVVLPGVGAIRDCVGEICKQGIDQVVAEVRKQKPLLGVCVGLQAMMTHSQENGGVDCLNLFEGEVKFFGNDLQENGEQLKVPHMGWNKVSVNDHSLWQGIENDSRFYFVHSFFVQAKNPAQVQAKGFYGVEFDAAVGEDNVFAVQFHPEKSHNNGIKLLGNFLTWNGEA